jgi:HlyD family secretion protein
MSCRAEIFTATKEAVLATPIQAILVEEDLELDETTRYAFVNRAGVADRVEVEVGLSDDTYQEITAGLKAGDEVITGPDRILRALEDDDRVRAVEADEDSPDAEASDEDSRATEPAALESD